MFEQLFKKEIQLAKMLGIESVNVAYTIKGLIQLRSFNYKLRHIAQNRGSMLLRDLQAYAHSIRHQQLVKSLPRSLSL